MEDLTRMKCVPCKGGIPPLTPAEMSQYQPQVPDWQIMIVDGVPHLERKFKFKNFLEALAFTNQVGQLAESEDHHPAILTEWGRVTITWWTHAIKGLHQNDFIMAARTDLIYKGK